jgi:SET domain-containing protein
MFNHQCLHSNLTVGRVQTYHRDKEIWKMCFFANKDIKKGDELTFNYFSSKNLSKKNKSFFDGNKCLCRSCTCNVKLKH